jgi:ketosteroid isomerase-like protein
MIKSFAIAFILILPFLANGQKDLDALIQAEKDFAGLSVKKGINEAFIHNMDEHAIIFIKGKPVNGYEFWLKQDKESAILKWFPQFAEIATSNNLGYTTGPYTFQESSLADSVAGRGQYTTVWRKDSLGAWKALIDIGTNYKEVNPVSAAKKIEVKKITSKTPQEGAMVQAEKAFSESIKEDPAKAYATWLSNTSILNHNGYLPAMDEASRQTIIQQTAPYTFELNGSGIATSNDLGFTYGSFVQNGKTSNYLRVWRHEPKGWKIALEVIK